MEQPVPGTITPPPAPTPAPPAPVSTPAPGVPPAYAEGGQTNSGNLAQYVAIVLIGLTFVNLILQISLSKKQHSAMKSDGKQDKMFTDIKELKLNVRKMLGDKYEQLS